MTSTATDPTNVTPIPVLVTFSAPVTGFELADIVPTNATAENLVAGADGTTYTFDLVPVTGPTDPFVVKADIPAGAAQGAGGDNEAAPQFAITFNPGVGPVPLTVVLTTTAADPTNLVWIPVTATFSADVADFDETDVAVGNGAISDDFTAVDARTYTFSVTAAADGPVTVDIAAGVATDGAGTPNDAATQLAVTFDGTAPTVAITTPGLNDPTTLTAIPVTIAFSEAVTTLTEAMVTVGNGTVDSVTPVGDGMSFIAVIIPVDPGAVTVDVAAGVVTDAAGNGNEAAAQFTITHDSGAPTLAMTSDTSDPTADAVIPVTITASEPVTGLTIDDLVVSNGTVANLVIGAGGTTATVDLMPTPGVGGLLVTLDIPAGAVVDAAGNPSVAAPQFTRTTAEIQPPALDAPTNVQASDGQSGADADLVEIQWDAVTSATHYMVFRSDEEGTTKTALTGWIAALSFKDTTAEPSVEYYYWVKAAADDAGARESDFSAFDTGFWYFLVAPPTADYKLTYKNCAVDVDDTFGTGSLVVTGTSDKSTIKIQLQKKDVSGKADKQGKIMYLNDWPPIPSVMISGDLKQIFTNCPISVLDASNGAVKKVTGKNANVDILTARQIGKVKMNALGDATAATPDQKATAIYTELAGVDMKVSVTGIILEELITNQNVKYLKAASKHYNVKTATTKEKRLSIGGIGDQFDVVNDVWGNQPAEVMADLMIAASAIKSISVKGGSIMPAVIIANVDKISAIGGVYTTTAMGKVLLAGNIRANEILSGVELKALIAKYKKYKGVLAGGFIGVVGSPDALMVTAPNMNSIYGYLGVSGVFIAGTDDMGDPDYSGIIKKISTKTGILEGEAHVLATSKGIKFKPDQGAAFAVYTSAP